MVVLTDRALARPRSVVDVVARALAGGAGAIQVREKEQSAREVLELALALRESTRAHGALLFLNDRFDIALAAEADGVHVGPEDLPVSAIRDRVPRDFLIGFSTDEPAEAVAAQVQGADYIGCGALFLRATNPTRGERSAEGVWNGSPAP